MLDINNYPNIGNLDLSKNQISTLDLSIFPNLESLCISNNPIKYLDVQILPKLEYIDIHGTLIQQIDIYKSHSLSHLTYSCRTLKEEKIKKEKSREIKLTCYENVFGRDRNRTAPPPAR